MKLKPNLLKLATVFLTLSMGEGAIAASLYTASVVGHFSIQMVMAYGSNLYNERTIFQLDETGKVSLKFYISCTYVGRPFFQNCTSIQEETVFDMNDQGQGIYNGLPISSPPKLPLNPPLPPQAYFTSGIGATPQLIGSGLATDINNQGWVTINKGNNSVAGWIGSGRFMGDLASYNNYPENSTAYLWNSQNQSWLNLGQGKAFGLNDLGQVVGSFGLWDNGVFQKIELMPGGNGYPYDQSNNPFQIKQLRAINNQGQIVALADGIYATTLVLLLTPYSPPPTPPPDSVPEPQIILGFLSLLAMAFKSSKNIHST